MSEEFRGDVDRKTGGNGFGGEHATEVVWGELQWLSVVASQARFVASVVEQLRDPARGNDLVGEAERELEQERERFGVQVLRTVVTNDERHPTVGSGDVVDKFG